MDAEGFGNCTNTYECEAVCPAEISASFIAKLNREYARARFRQRWANNLRVSRNLGSARARCWRARPAIANFCSSLIYGSRNQRKIVSRDADSSTPECALRVSQTHVHNSGSSSAFARSRYDRHLHARGAPRTIVEPEPDISAAPTSGCLSNHIFNCARKTNFSKTGRSRSLTKVWPANS